MDPIEPIVNCSSHCLFLVIFFLNCSSFGLGFTLSSKRSKVAMKSAKRLVMENLGPKGQLDTYRFAGALLLHRNTPDPLTGLSPAMILFGREVRDHLQIPAQEERVEA